MAKKLMDLTLPLGLDELMRFWMDKEWQLAFMRDKLLDLDISIGDWETCSSSSGEAVDNARVSSFCLTRKIRSFHPNKVSFPGLPSHAESVKTQNVYFLLDNKKQQDSDDSSITRVKIKEMNTFRGIPYADYFNVYIDWDIVCDDANNIGMSPSCSDSEEEEERLLSEDRRMNRKKCKVSISLDFKFFKSTWLQSTIESNTYAELIMVYQLWIRYAKDTLQWARKFSGEHHYYASGSREVFCISKAAAFTDLQIEKGGSHDSADYDNNNDPNTRTHAGSVKNRMDHSSRSSEDVDSWDGGNDDDHDDDDEAMFFDAISDPAMLNSKSTQGKPNRFRFGSSDSNASNNGLYKSSLEISSTKDMAVTIVEMSFVLAAYLFWKTHQFYMGAIDMFSVDPKEVLNKIKCTFLPGYHVAVLAKPDLWGPLFGVFCLPQSLVLSLDVSKHGCNQASMLGNAVVISISVWLGLSIFYRVVALIIAPSLTLSKCASIIGYSYFAWNIALLLSYPLIHFLAIDGIILKIPLILFGLPSSAAQGYVFWCSALNKNPIETAIRRSRRGAGRASSDVTPALSPNKVHQIIKTVAFILIGGLHFQSFIYMARVYLHEKVQYCHLSAILEFSKGFKLEPFLFLEK